MHCISAHNVLKHSVKGSIHGAKHGAPLADALPRVVRVETRVNNERRVYPTPHYPAETLI